MKKIELLEKLKLFPNKGTIFFNKKDMSMFTPDGLCEIRCKHTPELPLISCALDINTLKKSLNCFENNIHDITQKKDSVIFKNGRTVINQGILEYIKPKRFKLKNIKELPDNFIEACNMCIKTTLLKPSMFNNAYVHFVNNTMFFTDNIMCLKTNLNDSFPDLLLPLSLLKYVSTFEIKKYTLNKTSITFIGDDISISSCVYDSEPTDLSNIFKSKDKKVQLPVSTKDTLNKVYPFLSDINSIVNLILKDNNYSIKHNSINIDFNDDLVMSDVTFDYNLDINVNGICLHNIFKVTSDLCQCEYANDVIFFKDGYFEIALSTSGV